MLSKPASLSEYLQQTLDQSLDVVNPQAADNTSFAETGSAEHTVWRSKELLGSGDHVDSRRITMIVYLLGVICVDNYVLPGDHGQLSA